VGTYSSSYPAHGATGWDTILDGIIDAIDTRLSAAEASLATAASNASTALTAANNAYQKMSPTATKTSAYTAAVNDRVMCDTTSAGFTVTLPSLPTDKSRIAVRLIAGANTVTVNAGGTAHFNAVAGSTTTTLTQQWQDQEYQYNTTLNTWDVVKDSNLLINLNNLYAPFGASYKGIAFSTGAQVTTGYDLVPNGLPIVANATMTAVQITLIYPTIGGAQTWKVVKDSGGTFTQVATITVADGARGGVTNSLSVSLVAGDLLLVQCTSAAGTTYSGLGPAFRAAFGGSLALPSAPSAITGLSATGAATSVTLSWTAGTGSISSLVRRDGVPYAVVSTGSYTDLGPSGLGLSSGETHTYAVDALVPGNIAVGGGTVTQGTASSYTYYPAVAQNVSALTNDFVVTAGTNSPTAAVNSSGLATFTSGAVGANAVQDTIHVEWVKESGTQSQSDTTNKHSAWRMYTKFGFGSSAALMNHIFCENAYTNLTTSLTNYLQIQMTPNWYRLGVKTAGFNSGGFYNLSASTTSPAQVTSVGDTNGHVNWPITVTVDNTGATLYGLLIDIGIIKGDGSQDMKIYMGTAAQLDAYIASGTLPPLVNTATITAAQRSSLTTAMGSGTAHYGWELLGNQTGTGAQLYYEKSKTIVPLTAVGV
jgi:hypothetical protein